MGESPSHPRPDRRPPGGRRRENRAERSERDQTSDTKVNHITHTHTRSLAQEHSLMSVTWLGKGLDLSVEDHFWKEAKSISPPDDHTVQDETAKKEKHFQDVKVAAGNVCVSDFFGKKIIPVFFLWIRRMMIHKGFLLLFSTNQRCCLGTQLENTFFSNRILHLCRILKPLIFLSDVKKSMWGCCRPPRKAPEGNQKKTTTTKQHL